MPSNTMRNRRRADEKRRRITSSTSPPLPPIRRSKVWIVWMAIIVGLNLALYRPRMMAILQFGWMMPLTMLFPWSMNAMASTRSGNNDDDDDDNNNNNVQRSNNNGRSSKNIMNDMTGIEFMRHVHLSPYPVREAGLWQERPADGWDYDYPYNFPFYPLISESHQECLNNERQGKFRNKTADPLSDYIHVRPNCYNGIGFRSGVQEIDHYAWISDHEEYKTLDDDDVILALAMDRTIYLVGDSLMRHWAGVLRCQYIHIYNMTEQQAKTSVQYLWAPDKLDLINDDETIEFFQHVRPQDYLIFNFGLHLSKHLVGPDVTDWEENYRSVLRDAIVSMATVPVVVVDDDDNGAQRKKKEDRHRHRRHTRQQSPNHRQQRQWWWQWRKQTNTKKKKKKPKLKTIAHVLAPSHILFRTTTVPYFHRDMGDPNTVNAFARQGVPHNNATWDMYGGNGPMQPIQNLLAFDVLSDQELYAGKFSQQHHPDSSGGGGRQDDDDDEGGVGDELNMHVSMEAGSAAEGDSESILGTGNTTQTMIPSTASGTTTEIVGGVLDTATIMLARGDASFDGVHFCLPGPIQEWSNMLFYRIAQNNEVEGKKNHEGQNNQTVWPS
jgi:hypothetical protein